MSRKQSVHGPEGDARRRPPNPHHRDNYPHAEKRSASCVCSGCGLVLSEGRWYRGAPPGAELATGLCPACKRVRERDAAGTLELDAAFLAHRDEIERMARNEEEVEREEHPLERLIELREAPEGLVVTTTGVHLARRIANKLERRFHRQARFHYSDGDGSLRVDWKSA